LLLDSALSGVMFVRLFIHALVNCLNGQVEAMGQMVCLQVLEPWTNRFTGKGDIGDWGNSRQSGFLRWFVSCSVCSDPKYVRTVWESLETLTCGGSDGMWCIV
jgi:hypothetical protein